MKRSNPKLKKAAYNIACVIATIVSVILTASNNGQYYTIHPFKAAMFSIASYLVLYLIYIQFAYERLDETKKNNGV